MKASPINPTEASRPSGPLRPPGDRACCALEALDDDQLVDAARHLNAVEVHTAVDRAWKLALEGSLANKRAAPSLAEESLLMSLGLTWVIAQDQRNPDDSDAHRLAAFSMGILGEVYRRQERAAEAAMIHDAAYALAMSFGSYEELWALSTHRGLNATVTEQPGEALQHHEAALRWAEQSSIQPARRQAVSFGHMIQALNALGRNEDAVEAARKSCELWRDHDPGSHAAARADMILGSALLALSTQRLEQGDPSAEAPLDEAVTWLTQARESLRAFGSACAADAKSCQDRLAFVEQARKTLVTK